MRVVLLQLLWVLLLLLLLPFQHAPEAELPRRQHQRQRSRQQVTATATTTANLFEVLLHGFSEASFSGRRWRRRRRSGLLPAPRVLNPSLSRPSAGPTLV